MPVRGEIRIGTSGYQYGHWRGNFYPEALSRHEWFRYYTEQFDTVEINNTFYRLPSPATVDRWREEAPPSFCFATKFSRYGTHMKRLKDPQEPLERFFGLVSRLGKQLGPILVQLPPRFRANPLRLAAFLHAAARWRSRLAVEVRDPSWLCEGVYRVLREHRAALVIHDLIENHPIELTTDFTYLRFHGVDYSSDYSPQALSGQARRIRGWLDEGHDVYAYFNNDAEGNAPRNARDLRRFVERV